jgi:hypothetical protein
LVTEPKETGMWRCPECGEDHEELFDACWNCGTERIDQPRERPDPPIFESSDGAVGTAPQADSHSRRIQQLVAWARRSPWKFGATMVGLMFVLKIIVGALVYISVGDQSLPESTFKGDVGFMGFMRTAVVVVVLGSFLFVPIETLLGQLAPIEILRSFRVRSWLPLTVISAAFFGFLHVVVGGLPHFLPTALAGGIPLALCYLTWAERSVGYAIVATTLVHCGHNAAVIAIRFLGLLCAQS